MSQSRSKPTLRRVARWSKRVDELVAYVATGCSPSLVSELGRWLDDSPRFLTCVEANRDKIRKKLLNAGGGEGRLDVRAELRVAYVLVQDRRFEVGFETYGAHQRGPDLTVTYRANQRFNLEVTRLRAAADVTRLAGLIAAKVRQLPSDLPNALVITGQDLGLSEAEVSEAARLLKAHADTKDDAFFARRAAGDARTFYTRYLRLSGVLVLDESGAPALWTNREARIPLNAEVVRRLSAGAPAENVGAATFSSARSPGA